MKKLLIAGVLVIALAFTVSASAALVPGVFDPENTGCVKATFIKKTKTLHLEKNCPTPTNAAAGAEITGVSGRAPTFWTVPALDERDARRKVARRYLTSRADDGRWLAPGLQQRRADDERERRADTFLLPAARRPARSCSSPTTSPRSSRERAQRRASHSRATKRHFLLDGAVRKLPPAGGSAGAAWTSRVWPGALLVKPEIRSTWRRAQHTVRIDA